MVFLLCVLFSPTFSKYSKTERSELQVLRLIPYVFHFFLIFNPKLTSVNLQNIYRTSTGKYMFPLSLNQPVLLYKIEESLGTDEFQK